MLNAHMHVGCNVYEIQCQKQEHQSFQETAKVRHFDLCKDCWQEVVVLRSQLLTAPLCLHRARTSMGVSCWLQPWHWGSPASCPLTATVSCLRNSGIPGRRWRQWGRSRWRGCVFRLSSIVVLRRYSIIEWRLGYIHRKGHLDWLVESELILVCAFGRNMLSIHAQATNGDFCPYRPVAQRTKYQPYQGYKSRCWTEMEYRYTPTYDTSHLRRFSIATMPRTWGACFAVTTP
jgi:hypothetical protein